MRRLYITIFTLGVLLGMLTGCQNFFCHTAGVCDCDCAAGQASAPLTNRARVRNKVRGRVMRRYSEWDGGVFHRYRAFMDRVRPLVSV